jgi:hypothetical protein
VAEASRAPSAHNTQPARWRFPAPDRVELCADASRALPVADASGHDMRIALGAAWEGTALALGRHGLRLVTEPSPGAAIAAGRIEPGGAADPLADAVARRATWRGTFARASEMQLQSLAAALEAIDSPGGHAVSTGDTTIRWMADRADRASLEALGNPECFRELTEWLRLSPTDPGWSRDGLSAQAMQLSGFERAFARIVARPSAHGLLKATGLLSAFSAEAAKTRTASAMLLLLAPHDEPPFETGRRMYRLWLALTSAGWAACPMSALADDRAANREVRERCAIPAARRLVNVLRLGLRPAGADVSLAARLPARELLQS